MLKRLWSDTGLARIQLPPLRSTHLAGCPYAAALQDAGNVVNAIGAGPDSDDPPQDDALYARGIFDVLAQIKKLQASKCPPCDDAHH
jgi:hypothetical protein